MAKTYNKLNIEINQKVTDIITAVQDDTNSRYLDVQLFDNGTPINLTGQEVRIFLKKPDGTNIWNDGEVTNATEGRCQFLLTTQTLAVCGVLETQISIWQNNEEILSTEVFKIFVTKSLRSSGSIESSNEYGSLVILFQNIYEALDLMTEMVQSFGTAGAVAQGIPATTFWQMLEAVYTVNAEALANASVSEVLNRMGLTNDSGATATTGTLMGKVNKLIANPQGVKSRQEIVIGKQECSSKDASFLDQYYYDFSISPVNLDKSFIIANSSFELSHSYDYPACARFIDSSTIRVYVTYASSPARTIVAVYVQIIEFY